jgi:hypothetical protein
MARLGYIPSGERRGYSEGEQGRAMPGWSGWLEEVRRRVRKGIACG